MPEMNLNLPWRVDGVTILNAAGEVVGIAISNEISTVIVPAVSHRPEFIKALKQIREFYRWQQDGRTSATDALLYCDDVARKLLANAGEVES